MTWIIPKQIQSTTSASVLDTKESEKDLELFCQTCVKSLTWRGKDSQSRTWLQRWKKGRWLQHLSTRMLKPSHTESFEDTWISSLEAFRVSPLAQLENVKQLKTHDTCSPLFSTESESAEPQQSFLKMLMESSQPKQEMENPFSNMSSEAWKKWVTEQRLEYSQRVKLALLTKENESSSWGTPRAGNPGSRPNGKGGKVLAEQAQQSWPTARTSDAEGGQIEAKINDKGQFYRENKKGERWSVKLRDAVETIENKNWPTATTRDWKDTNATVPPSRANPSKQTLGQRVAHIGLQDPAKPNTNGKSQGSLNPNWVEQLMGLPVGWTDLGSWETE